MKEIIDEKDFWDKNISLERNDYIKQNDTIDTNLYFVTKGSLRVYVLDEGEEQTIRFGYKNSFISALDSYLTGEKSNFVIQAIKKSEVKYVSKKKLDALVNDNLEFKDLWMKLLESLVIQQIERGIDLLTKSPLERYKRVLKRSPQLFQEIPSKYIASYLRMTPETLSRINNLD